MFPLGKIASLQRQEKLGVKSQIKAHTRWLERLGWNSAARHPEHRVSCQTASISLRLSALWLEDRAPTSSADCHTADAVPEVHSPSAQGRKASNSLEMPWKNAADAFSWPAPAWSRRKAMLKCHSTWSDGLNCNTLARFDLSAVVNWASYSQKRQLPQRPMLWLRHCCAPLPWYKMKFTSWNRTAPKCWIPVSKPLQNQPGCGHSSKCNQATISNIGQFNACQTRHITPPQVARKNENCLEIEHLCADFAGSVSRGRTSCGPGLILELCLKSMSDHSNVKGSHWSVCVGSSGTKLSCLQRCHKKVLLA